MGTKTEKNKIIINQQTDASDKNWVLQDLNGYEGELAVDVYQDDKNLYIKSTIAGVDPKDLGITVNNDLLTIRGTRQQEEQTEGVDFFCRECYWGAFSRSVILPIEVKTDEITASLKNGVLTITLPKLLKARNIPIKLN